MHHVEIYTALLGVVIHHTFRTTRTKTGILSIDRRPPPILKLVILGYISVHDRHKQPPPDICIYVYCSLGPLAFLSLPAAGLFSCSRLRGTQGARPDPVRKFGPWPRSVARALAVESRTPLGEDSEHVEPSRPLQTHVQVKRMSGGFIVISGILNVINVVRPYLHGDGKGFPRHQHARHATIFNAII